ncbi:MAG: hypothetical protein AAGF97_09890 [Planctomycetota bacterium]
MSADDEPAAATLPLCTRCHLLCTQIDGCDRGTLQHPLSPPVYAVDGLVVAEDVAVQRAIELMTVARRPLIYGLTQHGVDAVRAATALADRLQAVIDLQISDPHRAAIRAEQQVGQLSASLAEIRERADALLFLNADPLRTHPRLLDRLGATRDVACLSIAAEAHGLTAHPSMGAACEIEPQAQWRMLRWLRYLALDLTPPPNEFSTEEVERAAEVAHFVQQARYLVVCWEPPAWDGLSELWVTELLRWLAALNHKQIAVSWTLTVDHAATAEAVLTWQTGYPCSVDFSQGYPQYDPQQWVGHHLLEQGATDGALLIGCRDDLSIDEAIPWIAVDCPPLLAARATVAIQTAEGTFPPAVYFRGDGVALNCTVEPEDPAEAIPSGSVARFLNRLAETLVRFPH